MFCQRTSEISRQRLRRRAAHRPEGAHDAAAGASDTALFSRRVDLASPANIPARADLVGETKLLLVPGARRSQDLHRRALDAALGGLGVDNAYVDLDAPEVPIMDGSDRAVRPSVQQAGITEQRAPKRFLRVTRRVEVKDGDKWARLEPYDGYKLAFSIEFKHPVIERSTQSVAVDFAETSYLKEIARAGALSASCTKSKTCAKRRAGGWPR